MFAVRKIPAAAFALLLSVGAMCAQICDVGCLAVYDHNDRTAYNLAATASKPAHDTSASGHCHRQGGSQSQASNSAPQRPQPDEDHSSNCLSHGHAAALIKSAHNPATDAAAAATDAAVAFLFYSSDLSFDRLIDACARTLPEPSPPRSALHSILRI